MKKSEAQALVLIATTVTLVSLAVAPANSSELPFTQQVLAIFNQATKQTKTITKKTERDAPSIDAYDQSQEIERTIKNDSIEKAKAIATSIETASLQFVIRPSTSEHDEILSARLDAIQLGNTASWLDEYSRGKPHESEYADIADSLYRSAYILNLKCGFIDHFTVLYLHRMCQLMNHNEKHDESQALWQQAKQFLAINATQRTDESLKRVKRAQQDMAYFDSNSEKSELKTNAVVSMVSSRILDADTLENLLATDASKAELCLAQIKLADRYFFDNQCVEAIPLVERALPFLESEEGQKTSSDTKLNEALSSLTFELAEHLDKCPGELLRRACKLSEMREPEGTKDSLINNLVEDKYAADAKLTDACLVAINQILEVRQHRNGQNSPTLEHALEGLVRVNRLAKRYDDALTCQQRVIEFLKINRGRTFFSATDAVVTRAEIFAEAGKFDQARESEALAIQEFNKESIESHPLSRATFDLGELAVVYAKLKHPDDCDRVLREAVVVGNRLAARSQPPSYPYQTESLVTDLINAYINGAEPGKAISFLQFMFDKADISKFDKHNSWRYTLAQLYLEQSSAMKASGSADEKDCAAMMEKSKKLFDIAQTIVAKDKDQDPERIAELVQARQDVLDRYGRVLTDEEKAKLATKQAHRPILTKKEVATYREVYKNPLVIYLRKAMDASLVGKGRSDEQKLFASWDKAYLASKFVVLSIGRGLMGGNFVSIIFQDKPDKVFRAWLYTKSKDDIELRTFDDAALPTDELNDIKKHFGLYLSDKELAI